LKAQFSRSELPPTQQSTTADVDLTGVHVLLVEDDMRTVYSLSALLQGRGCQVLIAENGRDALAVLEENQQVECVLTDIMMPEMDGYEMMRRLRADGRLKHLPIVALTAKAMAGEQERCLAAGASAYLSKPVDAKKLLGAVFEWTRGGRRVA
jgi:CheY-like chemotaxis protein